MKTTFGYLFKYKKLLALVFFLIFIQVLTQLFLPTLMGMIVDKGVVEGDIKYIWTYGAIMLFIALIGVLVAIASSYFTSSVVSSFSKDLREALFTHVSSFSLTEFNQIGTSSLITRTTNDVNQIQQAVMMLLRMVLTAPFMLVGGLIMAFSKDAKLSLLILAAIPFIIMTIYFILKKGMPLFKEVQIRLDHLNRILRENLMGIRVIRAFTNEKSEQKRLKDASLNLMNVSIKVNRIMAFTMPVMMLLMNLTIVLIIWFGGFRIEQGNMQIGDLMAFIQYVTLIMFALIMASMMFVVIPRATVSATRIEAVLKLEKTPHETGEKKLDKASSIQFKNVSFKYPNANEAVLENINFEGKAGETIAIIGGTGSGKTTLLNLITRLYEVSDGAIYINGVNQKETSFEDLRQEIGLVSQQANLFSGTIIENIQYGKPDATLEEIKDAAKIAQADEFIQTLKDGYETSIEQGGANLSGGQKQRLAIARALVRKPKIYLFDDSFSALDYETDSKLRQALQAEVKNSLVIIVGQRVTSVKNADTILVLEAGRIVGQGRHEELLQTSQVYQEIVESQNQEEVV